MVLNIWDSTPIYLARLEIDILGMLCWIILWICWYVRCNESGVIYASDWLDNVMNALPARLLSCHLFPHIYYASVEQGNLTEQGCFHLIEPILSSEGISTSSIMLVHAIVNLLILTWINWGDASWWGASVINHCIGVRWIHVCALVCHHCQP